MARMLPNSALETRVAVVEDDPSVLDSLQFVLEAGGYRVWPFERPQQAIDSHEIMTADCLLIDYALPDIDGLAMLGRLRQRGLSCPAILISGAPNARCRADAKKAGVPLVEKPILGDTLSGLLRVIIGG